MENTATKRVVCFGGGSVVPKLLMANLKNCPFNVTGVTSMVDNGGSTGQLREDFDVLPPGDIRRHILALSAAPEWKKKLWQFRFGQEEFPGGHKGHNFANIFIAGLDSTFESYEETLKATHDFMEVKEHQALPATADKTQLIAVLENGEKVIGEDEIDVPKNHDPNLKIKEVHLEPEAAIFPATRKAILEADNLIFGPGDLYSSTICCFLPEGMKEAFRETKAKKILIVNTMTVLGETNGFTVLDFANEVEKYIGCSLDYVIYNNVISDQKRVEEFKKENPLMLDIVKINENLPEGKFIGKDLIKESGPIVHEADKLIKTLTHLI